MISEAYRQVVQTLVVLNAPECNSFDELLRRVAGVYPAELHTMVKELTEQGLIDPFAYARLSTRQTGRGELRRDSRLPDPHPLDYDWRFDAATRETLIELCLRYSNAHETVVFLGTPSLLDAVLDGGRDRRWLLLEGSPVTASVLAGSAGEWARSVCLDLTRHDPPDVVCPVVVADPPWYPAYVRTFLWCAAKVTTPGGVVLLAQQGLATRPGLLAERAEDMAWATDHGFELLRVHPGAVGYDAPPFEACVLDAAGLGGVDLRWRRGDLIVLRRNHAPAGPRPPVPPEPTWDEAMIGRVRVRVRTDEPDADPAEPGLISITAGDVLSSVSRRDPLSGSVRVWTGSNRVFSCAAPSLLLRLLHGTATGEDPLACAGEHLGRTLTTPEEAAVRRAAEQITDLISVEARAWRTPVPRQ